MPSYNSTARVPFVTGGRVGLRKGGGWVYGEKDGQRVKYKRGEYTGSSRKTREKRAKGGRVKYKHGTPPKASKSKIKYHSVDKKSKSSYGGTGKKHIMKGKKWYQMDQT